MISVIENNLNTIPSQFIWNFKARDIRLSTRPTLEHLIIHSCFDFWFQRRITTTIITRVQWSLPIAAASRDWLTMISAPDLGEGVAEGGKVCITLITERVMHFWMFLTPRRRCHREKMARTRTAIGLEASVSPPKVEFFLNITCVVQLNLFPSYLGIPNIC